MQVVATSRKPQDDADRENPAPPHRLKRAHTRREKARASIAVALWCEHGRPTREATETEIQTIHQEDGKAIWNRV